jgi:predicted DNA-binding transcriptional regulator AlpA
VYIRMNENDDLFTSKGFSLSIKKMSCPRRGLSGEEAATYIEVSSSFFDELVKSGAMPKPIRIKTRTVWDVHQLDQYFEELSSPKDNPWDELR